MYTRDNHHQRIKSTYTTLLNNYNLLITTNLVISETFSLIRYRLPLDSDKPFSFLNLIDRSKNIQKITSTPELEQKAKSLLVKYNDHRFSYVDAVSFSLMANKGFEYALTLDHHFSTMGFTIVG